MKVRHCKTKVEVDNCIKFYGRSCWAKTESNIELLYHESHGWGEVPEEEWERVTFIIPDHQSLYYDCGSREHRTATLDPGYRWSHWSGGYLCIEKQVKP